MSFVAIDVDDDGNLITNNVHGDAHSSTFHPELQTNVSSPLSIKKIRKRRKAQNQQRLGKNIHVMGMYEHLPVDEESMMAPQRSESVMHVSFAGEHHGSSVGDKELTLSDVVIPAEFPPMDDPELNAAQMKLIAAKFNEGIPKSVIVGASARKGIRVDPGHYLLAHRNHRPEIAVGEGKRLITKIATGYTQVEYVGDAVYHYETPIIGAYGSYIVNVPLGKYAKVWSGTHPLLLGEGIHVIHDAMFRPDTEEEDGEDGDQPVAAPTGGGGGGPSNDSPSWLVDQNSHVVKHEDIAIVRVERNSIACVVGDTKPMFLPYREEPYIFDTPYFEYVKLVENCASQAHIQCKSLHRIVVPGGCIARVWKGAKPIFLEAQEHPHIIDDETFSTASSLPGIVSHQTASSAGSLDLVSKSAKVIQHGHITQVRPSVDGGNEVAVIKKADGSYVFSSNITVVEDPDIFQGFLGLNVEVLAVPSPGSECGISAQAATTVSSRGLYQVTTADSMRLAIKMILAYQVVNPSLVVKCLRLEDIKAHVEALALSDLATVVQKSTSQTYMDAISGGPGSFSTVWNQLSKHLAEYGIKLVRLGVEKAEILDWNIEATIQKQASRTAELGTELALLDQQMVNTKAEYDRDTTEMLIMQEANNKNLVTKAQAELEATKCEAEAFLANAHAKARSMELLGQQLRAHPELLQVQLAKISAEAIKEWRTMSIDDAMSASGPDAPRLPPPLAILAAQSAMDGGESFALYDCNDLSQFGEWGDDDAFSTDSDDGGSADFRNEILDTVGRLKRDKNGGEDSEAITMQMQQLDQLLKQTFKTQQTVKDLFQPQSRPTTSTYAATTETQPTPPVSAPSSTPSFTAAYSSSTGPTNSTTEDVNKVVEGLFSNSTRDTLQQEAAARRAAKLARLNNNSTSTSQNDINEVVHGLFSPQEQAAATQRTQQETAEARRAAKLARFKQANLLSGSNDGTFVEIVHPAAATPTSGSRPTPKPSSSSARRDNRGQTSANPSQNASLKMKINQLVEMGFPNRAHNMVVLQQHGGDVNAAATALLFNPGSGGGGGGGGGGGTSRTTTSVTVKDGECKQQ